MANRASLRAIVRGHVQGVFFRDFVKKQASALSLTGYVRNLPDGNSLEVVAEGETDKLKILREALRTGPPRSRVDSIESNESEFSGIYAGFKIRS